jgi:hypothetical protein
MIVNSFFHKNSMNSFPIIFCLIVSKFYNLIHSFISAKSVWKVFV